MAFLILGGERVALQIGDNVLGGIGDESVTVASLAERAPFASISVYLEVATTIRRLSDVPVTVDGSPLGVEPHELAHGSRIESVGLTIVFGDLQELGSTAHVAGISDDDLVLVTGTSEGEVAADTGGVLSVVGSGRSYPIPPGGLTIGRDPDCGIALPGRDVSRVHAEVTTTIRGYILTDRGINGVFVNGARVDGSRVLQRGDVIRVGTEELRFDADAGSFEPAPGLVPARGAGQSSGTATGGTVLDKPAAKRPATPLLATLEVITEGVLRGRRFRIEKSLASIGRGEHNDIQLPDGSVSGSHATLLHRGGAWHLTDLASTNGSYVDGVRVTGEHVLRGAAELRAGDIRMIFRPISAPSMPSTTRGIVGITEEQAKRARRS